MSKTQAPYRERDGLQWAIVNPSQNTIELRCSSQAVAKVAIVAISERVPTLRDMLEVRFVGVKEK